MSKKKYTYSVDSETYVGNCSSVKQAIKECLEEYPLEQLGERIWIGEIEPRKYTDFFDIESLLDNLNESAENECGEYAEDTFSIESSKAKELEKDFVKLLNKYFGKCNLSIITNEKTFEVADLIGQSKIKLSQSQPEAEQVSSESKVA